jgi:hypothetical protein
MPEPDFATAEAKRIDTAQVGSPFLLHFPGYLLRRKGEYPNG